MAHFVFKLQTKNTFLYGESMMNLVMVVFFWVAWWFMINENAPSYVFLPFFAAVLHNIFIYKPMLRDWDMGGYSSLVVDTEAREVILDKDTKLSFDDIERVRIELEARPKMIWFLTCGHHYHSLVNGEIYFKHNDESLTVASIQLKKEVIKLKKLMRSCGIPCRIQKEEFMHEKIPTTVWKVILFILVCIYIFTSFLKYINNI